MKMSMLDKKSFFGFPSVSFALKITIFLYIFYQSLK